MYENEGKRSGAYVGGVYGVGPYMLLNHNDTQNALFTLAHEGGHAMHTILSYEKQPFVTSSYTIFVAEVASTTNERFLLNQLLQTTTDPKERFLLLQHAVDSIVGTFYTQVLFADFEMQAHKLVEQGKPVTAAVLNGIYLQLLKDYYGDAVTVDEAYQYTWSRIPHFFNSPYYVYQYATCFASSAKLFKDMTTGEPASARRSHRALPGAAAQRWQRPPHDATAEGRCGPVQARDRAGRGGPDARAGVADGGRGRQDSLGRLTRQTCSRLPNAKPGRSQLNAQLHFHAAGVIVRHRVVGLVEVGQQVQTKFLSVFVGLDTRFVFVKTYVRVQAGHADIDARLARDVAWIGPHEPGLAENVL